MQVVLCERDLQLITGDVINGNYSAAGLKEAYSSAESVIKTNLLYSYAG